MIFFVFYFRMLRINDKIGPTREGNFVNFRNDYLLGNITNMCIF